MCIYSMSISKLPAIPVAVCAKNGNNAHVARMLNVSGRYFTLCSFVSLLCSAHCCWP